LGWGFAKVYSLPDQEASINRFKQRLQSSDEKSLCEITKEAGTMEMVIAKTGELPPGLMGEKTMEISEFHHFALALQKELLGGNFSLDRDAAIAFTPIRSNLPD
jgi:hypothetical protein